MSARPRPKRIWVATSDAWRGPTGQSRLFGAPPPLIFWRQKLRGFGRQNSDADCVAGTRAFAPSAPAVAGEGDHWSSRSERTVVEGARDVELRCRCKKFSQEEASQNVWTSRRLLWHVESCAPSTTLLRRAVPLPRYRGGG
jgi:hypothetical protein